ncbi:RHS repeat-associated core domain-containing protein [Kitasatospora sp. NPDC048298]|uniref:RHS repeat-associated core domain-containing protein n=1 Tax=Kitasatospora sp. NPDC048298 TaxID=3364049 RepID=UPI003713381B
MFAPVLDAGRLATLLVEEGRFAEEPGTDHWWRPGTVRTYAGLQDFFVPVSSVDPFGAVLVEQYDAHRIVVLQATESGAGLRDQRVRVDTFDYAKLVPTKFTDINDDVSEVLLDPLARVVRTSRHGEENGVLVGFEPLAGKVWPEPTDLAGLVGDAAGLLGGAESLYFYDLASWGGTEPRPAAVARVVAQKYPGTDVPPPWLTVEYADGFGRVFERKTEAEPSGQGGPRRWITSGRIRFNAAGSPYKAYRPYYSDTYRSGKGTEPDPVDAAVLLTYDALDRPVRIDTPLGVHTTLSGSAWSEVESDFCDTVRTSRYWAVALLAVLRTNGFLDFRNALTILFQPEQPGFSLGLPQQYEPYAAGILHTLKGLRARGVPLTSRFGYDTADNQALAVDPRLPALGSGTAVNFRRTFALDGSVLLAVGADDGARYTVPDCRGQPVLCVDGTGAATQYTYDALGRLSTVTVHEGTGTDARHWTAERWIYGDSTELDQKTSTAGSLNGRLWRVFDESGLVEYADYTLTGEAKRESRRFLKDPASPDWTAENSTAASPLLDTTAHTLNRRFDALGRTRAQEVPGGDRLEMEYLLSGRAGATRLVTADGRTLPCVVSTAYSAEDQPTEIAYGNGVLATYGYDRLTAALTTLRTTRASDGTVLQDLTVYRDVMGNVTHLTDAAFGPLFGLPAGFDADSDNAYDALYRLVSGHGIERAGRDADADREGGYTGLTVPWTSSGVDPAELASYRRLFAYDTGDNLYAVVHESAVSPWSDQLVLSDASNRAVESAVFGGHTPDPLVERVAPAGEVDAFFGLNGNRTRLPGIEEVAWTYRNQIEILDVGGARDRYTYDGVENRVRTIAEQGAARHEVIEVGPARLERETSADGTTVARRRVRVVSDSLLVAEYLTEGSEPGRLVFNLGDPLRSIAIQTGDQGALLTYEGYVPYGGTAFAIAPDGDRLDEKVARYSAQPRDRSSGLVYYGARYLAPWSGRWVSPDPSGPVDGLNLYAFVTGNPTSAIDLGGRVRGTVRGGVAVDVSAEEILERYHVAATQLAQQSTMRPITQTQDPKAKTKLPIYEVSQHGQLFGLAYQKKGDPIGRTPVTSFRL